MDFDWPPAADGYDSLESSVAALRLSEFGAGSRVSAPDTFMLANVGVGAGNTEGLAAPVFAEPNHLLALTLQPDCQMLPHQHFPRYWEHLDP